MLSKDIHYSYTLALSALSITLFCAFFIYRIQFQLRMTEIPRFINIIFKVSNYNGWLLNNNNGSIYFFMEVFPCRKFKKKKQINKQTNKLN